MTSHKTLALLRAFESRNVTFLDPDGTWPIVWSRARGVHVWDAGGRKYLDLTAAFGVAAAGHANPRVVQAGQWQMKTLLHAMGDVHPHARKAELARELSRITFERWAGLGTEVRGRKSEVGGQWSMVSGQSSVVSRRQPEGFRNPKSEIRNAKAIFCNSGFEAVEAALKTAMLATGKPGVIGFEGAYHGLGYGALNATHRSHFRGPFRQQLREFGHFVPFPDADADLDRLEARMERLMKQGEIGAVLAEPIQVRGGVNVPPPNFLRLLRRLCNRHRAILILDEIYTGFGRTGRWFACEHDGVAPDVICLGKALAGGFPISACVGRSEVMDAAWPISQGEAIHTSTFLGHPVGCAMALAQIKEIQRLKLIQRSERSGAFLVARLKDGLENVGTPSFARLPPSLHFGETSRRGKRGARNSEILGTPVVRGLGLLVGLELRHRDGTPATSTAFEVVKTMLRRGFILLPEGEHGQVISFTPPLTITTAQLGRMVEALMEILTEVGRR